MNAPLPLVSGPNGGHHPAVMNRRVRDLALIGVGWLIPVVIALGIVREVPNPSFVLAFAVMFGVTGVLALMFSRRLELTVMVLAIYLGCLDGPVKLLSAGHEATAVIRDVLIFAVCLGAIMRLVASRQRIQLPPLSGWIVAWVLLVLVNAVNPNTDGIVKALGGFRQELEWIPFFFFGYALIRSKARFRQMFLLLGVIALANGLVSTYQTRLTPGQLAAWGPGYHERVNGTSTGKGTGTTGRKYISEGVERVRPMALGSDSGFGGSIGVIALAGALSLLAVQRRRRRWIAVLLCVGSLLAVATCLGRLQVVGSVIALFAFAGLSLCAGRRVGRPLKALLAIMALALPLGLVLISAEGAGVFSRYESIGSKATSYKTGSREEVLKDIEADPFGFGLGTAGAATGFGGRSTVTLEGHSFSAETQYNFVTDELGLPGLLLYVSFSLMLMTLAVRRLRRVEDVDVRICIVGVFAAFIAVFIMGTDGPVLGTAASGPFFWLTGGIAAYWLAGPGQRSKSSGSEHTAGPTIAAGAV